MAAMNAEDMGRVLARCASYDRRKTGEADIIAWLQVIGDLAYDDCIDAVIAHYAESTDWIMPAHIRQRVRAVRAERLAATSAPPPPPELLSHPHAYVAAVAAANGVIMGGGTAGEAEQAMQAIAAQVRRELESETP
jgi:hypothetical protein